jgi:hypothetical protein
MRELVTLEARLRQARRGQAAARARSLSRRAMGPLFWKYLSVAPAVFSARGDLYAFRLLVPRAEALARLRHCAVLTLDSATEALAGFRFGRAANEYAYFASRRDVDEVEALGLGERRPGTSFPFAWTPAGREMLFAVVPPVLPSSREVNGTRVVSREELVRDLIGFYGLRQELLAALEAAGAGWPTGTST